jgi:hypothetical protein
MDINIGKFLYIKKGEGRMENGEWRRENREGGLAGALAEVGRGNNNQEILMHKSYFILCN